MNPKKFAGRIQPNLKSLLQYCTGGVKNPPVSILFFFYQKRFPLFLYQQEANNVNRDQNGLKVSFSEYLTEKGSHHLLEEITQSPLGITYFGVQQCCVSMYSEEITSIKKKKKPNKSLNQINSKHTHMPVTRTYPQINL